METKQTVSVTYQASLVCDSVTACPESATGPLLLDMGPQGSQGKIANTTTMFMFTLWFVAVVLLLHNLTRMTVDAQNTACNNENMSSKNGQAKCTWDMLKGPTGIKHDFCKGAQILCHHEDNSAPQGKTIKCANTS